MRVEMGCKAQTADCFCDPAEIFNAAQRLETVSMSALAAATGRLWTAFQTRAAPSLKNGSRHKKRHDEKESLAGRLELEMNHPGGHAHPAAHDAAAAIEKKRNIDAGQ